VHNEPRADGPLHDHRKLGRELELFDTDPLIGAGLPYLRPAGAAVRHELEGYVYELERKAGYQHVYSPVIAKRELYQISGHWDHYRDGMYPPMDIGGEQVLLRPSLCPHHAVIYRSRAHSYRELPLRLAELGGMYRSELSGVLGGLTRVRSIQLNDAHIFCTPDQVAAEAAAALSMIREAYRALGIEPARYRLSLAGASDKYVGRREMWDRAAAVLREVLDGAGLPYQAEEGEAAFYGPKIDVQVADSSEREASLSTVQVDFYQPERFGLEYIGADGGRHRPVMVHRSIIGGLERLLAHLIDVHGGAFPPWLAPVQLVVLPIGEDQVAAARAVLGAAIGQGLRAELATDGSLGARVREHRLVPYQAVIGAAEATASEVSLRLRNGQKVPSMPAAEALRRIGAQVCARSPELWQPV
jgi:threonyl-tRNA synthetase